MRTRIKFCGLTEVRDVQEAVIAGADAVGFVLFPKSKRHVDTEQLKLLARHIPAFITPVLLFVNPTEEEVHESLRWIPEATLQFHGTESPLFCEQFDAPWIKAVAVRTSQDLPTFAHRYSRARALLVDAPSDQWGGSGKTFDWRLLGQSPIPLILAGGLNSSNVEAAIEAVRPFAVDVSSGIENAPGKKDSQKMRLFVQAVQRADSLKQ